MQSSFKASQEVNFQVKIKNFYCNVMGQCWCLFLHKRPRQGPSRQIATATVQVDHSSPLQKTCPGSPGDRGGLPTKWWTVSP